MRKILLSAVAVIGLAALAGLISRTEDAAAQEKNPGRDQAEAARLIKAPMRRRTQKDDNSS